MQSPRRGGSRLVLPDDGNHIRTYLLPAQVATRRVATTELRAATRGTRDRSRDERLITDRSRVPPEADSDHRDSVVDSCPDGRETFANRMRIARQHGLDPMSGDLGQVSIVDSRSSQMSDVTVPALVGADV